MTLRVFAALMTVYTALNLLLGYPLTTARFIADVTLASLFAVFHAWLHGNR